MGLFRRRPRPVQPDDYFAAGSEYLAYLKDCFEWNFENRPKGQFFPLHISACFGAAHATTALLHSLPDSPYFSQPWEVDEEGRNRLLLRMEHVIGYLLIRKTDADDDLVRRALEEACEFFARSRAEHDEGLAFVGELLAEDTWENRASRVSREILTGRARGPGEVGLLAGYLVEPITARSDDPIGATLDLTVTNAEFVVPCLEHGLETALAMFDEIGEKGWDQFVKEMRDDPEGDASVRSWF
jgi:hypothetical protein